MRRVYSVRSPGRGAVGREEPSVLDFDVVARHGVGFEARFAQPGAPMVLPVVPGTDDELAIQRAVRERATRVVADAGEDAEFSVHVGHNYAHGADRGMSEPAHGEALYRAELDPDSHGCGGGGMRRGVRENAASRW